MNMNLSKNFAISGLFFSLLSASAMADDSTDGSYKINFNGKFTSASCVVGVNDQDKSVNLGEYKINDFKSTGSMGAKIPFTISLNNCDTSTIKTAAITMQGTTVEGNSKLLAPTDNGSGQTVAQNVGIEVRDSEGKAITFDGNTLSSALNLHDGDSNNILLSARYVSTGAASAGTANATAYFRIVYQ